MNAQELLNDMVSYLEQLGVDEFDAHEAVWFWLNNNHHGQNSIEYQALCLSPYNPGIKKYPENIGAYESLNEMR